MKKRRLCFVVSDLLGLVKNSGIGTATSYTAIVLAAAGHDVTLVHIRPNATLDPAWEARYRGAGISVEAVSLAVATPSYLASSYLVYEHLKDRDFDVILFQDWTALGWASTQAKHAGVAFERSQLIHVAHGPEAWLHEANLETALGSDELAMAYAGKTSAEHSDAVMGPSQYLVDWMASAGWQLPERRFVIPYFTEGHAKTVLGEADLSPAPGPAEPAPLREIAFFGRLERRKGVQEFVQAINRLEPSRLDGIVISFLGREASYTTDDVLALFEPTTRRAAAGICFHTDFDNEEACRYLQRPGTLAVIASLVDNSPNTVYECIERRIPFLATSTGGTPELVHEEDRSRSVMPADPRAMAERLDIILAEEHAPAPVRPAFGMASSMALWEQLLDWEPPTWPRPQDRPMVTAVLPHHDRPGLLFTALEALDAQDYPALEIVVVDDGSELPESARALNEIERRSWHHQVVVMRQENRYLGAARNAGAAVGRGDLIVFVDDDDVPVGHFVSSLVKSLQISGADAVTCAMQSFMRKTGSPEPGDSRGTWLFAGGPLYLAAVQNCLGGAPMLIRRTVFEALGGYHERYGVGFEDWHLYVRLLLAGHRLLAVPEPLYWYRLHDGSMRATMCDFNSAHMIVGEFRAALAPTLGPLADLAFGQRRLLGIRVEQLRASVDLRDRMLWLADERLARLEGRRSGSHMQDNGAVEDRLPAATLNERNGSTLPPRALVRSLRRGLGAGRAWLRQVAPHLPAGLARRDDPPATEAALPPRPLGWASLGKRGTRQRTDP